MTKKILLTTTICITTLLSAFTYAKTVKTSSLSPAKAQVSAKLPQQCQKLFSETTQLIRDAARQPGTHDVQVKRMQNKLSRTQQQILQLDVAVQQKSCGQGLIALNNMKKRH